MKQFSYYPWVGPLYHLKGINNKQTLVLGESFYCGECAQEDCELTDGDCSEMFLNNFLEWSLGINKKQRTYTMIGRLLCNIDNTLTEQDIWKRVAFYNYIQKGVGAAARERPKDTDFSNVDYYENLKYLVSLLKPQILIVLGYSLWDNMYSNKEDWSEYKVFKDENNNEISTMKFLSNTIAFPIKHPAGGLSYEIADVIKNIYNENSSENN